MPASEDPARSAFPALAATPEDILGRLPAAAGRVLLAGQAGVGKSTLATNLGRALARQGRPCVCLGADPGSPGFGVPGAVCLGQWSEGGWRLTAVEGLCTLDAGRFRLPLVSAVQRLAAAHTAGTLLVDGPGVVRGIAGAELLVALAQAAQVDAVLVLVRDAALPLAQELSSLGVPVFAVQASSQACRPGKRVRARRRTALWDAYLAPAEERSLDLESLGRTGAPPPLDEPQAWPGRQVAVLAGHRTVAMGEVIALEGTVLRLRAPPFAASPSAIMVRDARRTAGGLLETAAPFAGERLQYLPAPEMAPFERAAAIGGPRLVGRVGEVTVALVNGVFGDPLLHLRLRHQRRSLLFDLGEGGRLPARIAHQVTDVFISHAHMDHIGGFLWLLRSRIGELPACRLYGPPGLAGHVEGLLNGILWDRVENRGPRFEVAEYHGDHVLSCRLRAGGSGCRDWTRRPAPDGLLLQDPAFRVRAVTLDHGTPVLAFAFEPHRQLNVRKDRLAARGLAPGPWLGELKAHLQAERTSALVTLPDGRAESAGRLGEDLILVSPGKRLVYATDLADSDANRRRLTALAAGAHTFFCEASFRVEDVDQARRTGHLTTRACAEIANQAAVGRLVPFHFSRRYLDDPAGAYEEIVAWCPRTAVPSAALLAQDATRAGLGEPDAD